MNQIVQEVKSLVLEEMPEYAIISDEDVLNQIDEKINVYELSHERLPFGERILLRMEVLYSIRGLGMLQLLLKDPSITEIMVNGHQKIFVEKNGRIMRYNREFDSDEQLEELIQKMVSSVNRVVNETRPIVDARLKDGSRVNAVLPPIALDGPILTIRKFPKQYDMDHLVERGSITKECAEFLKSLVVCRYNIFISGGTGAGKTTFLNALSQYVPKGERIITIEDSAELQICHPNLVRLEARNENMEGKNAITIRTLIKTALRMRPDRIIVGEVRADESIDMLSAMNTGHDGSLSTGHSNSARDMLSRLETMVLMGMDLPLAAVRSQIASAIDILVHLERFRDGSRRVVSVEEVIAYQNGEICTQPLYLYDYEAGCLYKTENSLLFKGKLEKQGT